MKCPWMEITTHEPSDSRVDKSHYAREIVTWGDCYKDECPYYGGTMREHRQSGGYREIEVPACTRVRK